MPRNEATKTGRASDGVPTRPPVLDKDAWPCPGFAPHPPRLAHGRTSFLDWTTDKPAQSRTLDYTCACQPIVYELVASGGSYRIRRTERTAPPRVTYAGPWRRQAADRIWAQLLSGEVSLCT
ncbi:hypothetical protein GCM10010176_097880 [Nonomuraea spiralis]|nr:hypothetical protein GCM10010176_097880 [Nonomuraea spiralis]